jgi:hypothetical protein
MPHRKTTLGLTLLAAAGTIATLAPIRQARAAEADPARARPPAARVSAPTPAPASPRTAAGAAQALPGCDPINDVSCTVIRETPDGTVVTTVVFRKGGPLPAVWTPSRGAAAPPAVDGTICVSPSSGDSYTVLFPSHLANEAPILD